MRRAWTGRDHDALRPHRFRLGYRNLIVAANLDLRSQFAEILDQVIGERIVVTEYEDQAASPSSNRLSPEFAGLFCRTRPPIGVDIYILDGIEPSQNGVTTTRWWY